MLPSNESINALNPSSDFPEGEPEPLLWECPRCSTINMEVMCDQCNYMPDYYMPIDPSDIDVVTEEPAPPPRIQDKKNTWTCKKCGTINDNQTKKCESCTAPRAKSGRGSWAIALVFLSLILLWLITIPQMNKTSSSSRKSYSSSSSQNSSSGLNLQATAAVQDHTYPNPPVDGCQLWSDMSVSDEGKTVCVYGLVYDNYVGDKNHYFIRFSKEKNTFRMVLMNGVRMNLSQGDCLYQTGKIKTYDKLVYMEFDEEALRCKK